MWPKREPCDVNEIPFSGKYELGFGLEKDWANTDMCLSVCTSLLQGVQNY